MMSPRNDSPNEIDRLVDDLPAHLAARTTPLASGAVDRDGDFVLCWLHHAVRGHDNPVLDVAVHLGNVLGKPVLVYQGLGGNHRYNSDRHHTFIMEGARDLQAELAAREIACAFHLPADPATPGPLTTLTRRACLLVTEDFPAPPFPRWTRRLVDRTSRATLLVDGACLMPIRTLASRHTRAFKFRDAARGFWRSTIAATWHDVEPTVRPFETTVETLGFASVDLETADIARCCAGCDIDHGIPPVTRIAGGSNAGYARWEHFRTKHLGRYDRRRNDAADMDAVSCLSPYLHHGHVSPFRIAREAQAKGGKGAEKFLDELLVWRELAFNFCLHTREEDLESIAALPDWAQRTLADHAADEREATYSWETLARAATGHELWDHAQRSLLVNGELHNNLRMTWGKAVAAWTKTPDDALHKLIDLNHRYALDGNNPNSYGGLLWCLGQFDRPFSPEQSVLGTVRGRSVDVHAERLDPARYAAAVDDRRGAEPLRVAIVGGGIAGLTCARTLQDQGCTVTIFDRGRGPGGRLATRLPRHEGAAAFDHGAPYFTVSDARFGRYVRSWIEDGVCARWIARTARWDGVTLDAFTPEAPLIVGTPSMNTICRHLAHGLDVRSGCVVSAIACGPDGWTLSIDDDTDAGGFDAVVVACAPEQASRLVGPVNAEINTHLMSITSHPTWAGMFTIDEIGDELPDVLDVTEHDAIEKVIRNERKPGRPMPETTALLVHAPADFSLARYDADRNDVAAELTAHTVRLLSAVLDRPRESITITSASAHRWGLARPAAPSTERCLADAEHGLVVCGDGCGGSGVEAAFLGAQAAAGRILALRPRRERASTGTETGSLFPEHAS